MELLNTIKSLKSSFRRRVLASKARRMGRTRNRAVMETLENRELFSLLGILPNAVPVTNVFGDTGAINYHANTFDMSALPQAMKLSTSPLVVADINAPSTFTLHFGVDSTGNLIAGTQNDTNLVLTGSVDVDNDGVDDLSGTLLTGKIVAMGSQDGGDNLTADRFDFRFQVTGGLMASYFSGSDIGLVVSSENSTFTDFTSDFTGGAKGTFAPIAPVVTAPPPVNISGFKYQDITGNGLSSDDYTHPLSGVTIQLYSDSNGNGKLDSNDSLAGSTKTTGNGAYAFTNLAAGTYFVKEVQPSGYIGTAPASGLYTVNATSGSYANLNFDNYKVNCGCSCSCGGPTLTTATSSLAGTVFVDCDNDGKKDSNEAGISGVKITLTGTDLLGNNVCLTTTTDCSGNYKFSKLVAGNYTITETDPDKYSDGKDSVGSLGGTLGNDSISNITVPPCSNGTCYDFGEVKCTTICGNTGHGGCKVIFNGCDDKGRNVCYVATTDCHGNYSFDNCTGGRYNVSECDSKGRSTGYSHSCDINWSDKDRGFSCNSFSSCSFDFSDLFKRYCR